MRNPQQQETALASNGPNEGLWTSGRTWGVEADRSRGQVTQAKDLRLNQRLTA